MATANTNINNDKIFVETTYARFDEYKSQAEQDNSVVFIKDKGLIWARDNFYGVSTDTVDSINSSVAKLGTALKWKGPNDTNADTISVSGSGSTVINNYTVSNISVIEHSASETSAELNCDTYNIWPEVSSLSITKLNPRSDNYLAKYMFEFISSSTGATLTLPSGVKIAGQTSILPSKRYQVSIINNIANIISVEI